MKQLYGMQITCWYALMHKRVISYKVRWVMDAGAQVPGMLDILRKRAEWVFK